MAMALRGWPVIAALALAALLAGAGRAGAATQLGQLTPPLAAPSGCGAGQNTIQTFIEAGGPPYTVSAGGGVITAWQHRAGSSTVGSGRLQIWRGSVMGTTFTMVGRSELEGFSSGVTHSFPTRIPVSAGDLLGFRVSTEATCAFNAPGLGGDDTYRDQGMLGTPDPSPGDPVTFPANQPDRRLNVSATLEPDADGDGFGDETQDQCLGSAGSLNGCVPDTSLPDTQITNGPKDKTKKKQATFEFTGTDARAVASFECSLDGATFTACTSPQTVKVKKGKHTFSVRTIDAAGNVDGSPASDSWKVKRKKKKR